MSVNSKEVEEILKEIRSIPENATCFDCSKS